MIMLREFCKMIKDTWPVLLIMALLFVCLAQSIESCIRKERLLDDLKVILEKSLEEEAKEPAD